MHFLKALENREDAQRPVLFEGVCTGAADGWYRMKDTPASTLLHLGPGLANGLANIHNAKRASSGMVNIMGEHSASHLKYDPPLTSDIEGLARPLSHWVRRVESPNGGLGCCDGGGQGKRTPGPDRDAHPAWRHLVAGGGRAGLSCRARLRKAKIPDAARIEHIAKVLRSGEPTLIILAGRSTRGVALELAGKIKAATGCRIATQFFSSRIERGAGRVTLERIPYAVGLALSS
jgi:acetolactate synthase-1/2/3 large subunit